MLLPFAFGLLTERNRDTSETPRNVEVFAAVSIFFGFFSVELISDGLAVLLDEVALLHQLAQQLKIIKANQV